MKFTLLLVLPAVAFAALKLEEIERMATERNPAVARAEANVAMAEGRRRQAGAYPNPVVGLNADEVNNGPTIRYGEWGGFASQQIVTAGKRGLDRGIAGQDAAAAKAESRAERQRVINAARTLFYQALADQRLIDVRTEMAAIARNTVKISRELANVGQADQPDILNTEVEEQRTELGLQLARNAQTRTWRQLSALVDRPLVAQPLEGDLDAIPKLDIEATLAALEKQSPDLEQASAAVARAQLSVKRAEVARIPDIEVRSGLRYNRELLELNRRPVGLETFLDVGVRIPLFDRNRGNIAAAKAGHEAARLESHRVALSLRSRAAAAYRDYADATQTAERYRAEMIPRAEKAWQTYLGNFRAMAAAYPMALNAQRNLFMLREQHVEALAAAWRSVVELEGLLLSH
jgi:outer membrane protein, heavy metal efflux system